MHQSVATLNKPEFVNITSISPLVSKCEIKVLYVGQNRNRSTISKEVATQMAQTLPGCPIVGRYLDSKEDFGDHGEQVIIDGEGVKFNKLTKPYGFIAPDSKVWFQTFDDTDDLGQVVTREYLMTEGYLWTGQYEECKKILEEGKPHSMELDEKSLKGFWSEDVNKGVDFFIINDATFSALCILGDDVEPCFEGSSVKKPEISASFSKDNDFTYSLFTMMKELKEMLKGGTSMENVEFSEALDNSNESSTEKIDNSVEEVITTFDEAGESTDDSDAEDAAAAEVGADEPSEEEVYEATENSISSDKKTEFAKEEEKEEKDDTAEEESDDEKKEDPAEDKKEEEYKCGSSDDEDKKKYQLLEEKYAELEKEVIELREFKAQIDNQKKDELIDSFTMLSDDEKKDVIENKLSYSLEDIESKLSIIFARKQMAAKEQEAEVETAPVTYSISDSMSGLPDWVKAVREHQENC